MENSCINASLGAEHSLQRLPEDGSEGEAHPPPPSKIKARFPKHGSSDSFTVEYDLFASLFSLHHCLHERAFSNKGL